MTGEPALELQRIVKRFGSIPAIDGVDMRVEQGERRALLGTNGAGKTTLFNLIAGEIQATEGRMRLFGRLLGRTSVHRRARMGIARSFQSSLLFESLSVRQNLDLARSGTQGRQWRIHAPAGTAQSQRDTCRYAERVGLAAALECPAGLLSHGQRRQLEVGMALIQRPRLLLLDEPAAGLSPGDRPMLRQLIRDLPREMTVLMIEHDMDIALALADSVTVMRDGRVVAEGFPQDIRSNPVVRDIYLGAAHG